MKHTYVYDHYYKYGEIAEILKGYAEKHPEFCELSSIGTTPEGREMLLISVTDLSTGGFETKPALFLEANIHAGEVTGSMTVMFTLDTIFSNLDDPKIAKMLATHTIYVLPRIAVDGSEYYLTDPGTLRSAPRFHPFPELQPGLQSKDMDGDGVIRQMRIKTPYGAWKKSEKDPRVMVRRQPDELEGEFYNVYSEGYIEGEWDGLEITPAPAPFGNDFNRNYPLAWAPEHQQVGSGDYPLSNPENKANTDFILSHPNICGIVNMHTSGGQNLYPPGWESPSKADREDIALNKTISRLAHEENGYVMLNISADYLGNSTANGSFDDFSHFALGIPSMSIECWDLSERAGIHATYPPKDNKTDEEKEDEAVATLKWIDENVSPDIFKPWTEFEHPQLGKVEIGGAESKFIVQNPPPEYLLQEVEKHTRFFLRFVNILPQLKVESIETKKLGEGVHLVEAVIGNRGYMSTYLLKEALKLKKLKGVSLEIKGVELAQGKAKADVGHLLGGSGYMARSYGVSAGTAIRGGNMQKKVTWLVKGNPGDKFSIEVTSGKAGSFTVEGEIK